VRYREFTPDGLLRHATFKHLRTDKLAHECERQGWSSQPNDAAREKLETVDPDADSANQSPGTGYQGPGTTYHVPGTGQRARTTSPASKIGRSEEHRLHQSEKDLLAERRSTRRATSSTTTVRCRSGCCPISPIDQWC
jgi:hypothetical protein